MSTLFEGDSDSELTLKTDTEYAKKYDQWRQKEELHRLQMKYGSDYSGSDSSSSSEDDEGDEINEKFEKDFLKTLSCLKNKDPRVYDTKFEFFSKSDENGVVSPKKKIKEQPMYLKDYERQLILEKGGELSDEENEQAAARSSTYVEEQAELKNSLKDALDAVDKEDADDSEWGGMFKTRQKSTEEKKKEEEDYLHWLAGQKEHLNDDSIEQELKPLKDYWNNPELDEGEKFLRDYVLKKKFLGEEDKDYIPTYDEVIHDSDEDLSEDEKVVNNQEEFEHKYNFRFEEPDQEFIKRYPRTMENSLRQKDDKRSIKRLERKERKKLEKQQKLEEIGNLKALKKNEIEEKINKLKEITGNTEVGFELKDLEDDFDPEEHDKRMQKLFSDEFYGGPEGEQKPEFPELDEELELENWDRWHGDENDANNENAENENCEPHCEDEDFNMDCDYDPTKTQEELIENTKKRKRRKRKSKFAEVLGQPKPVFDPNDKTYQQYLEEYYKLDCEDVIGDVPCRFKYREVVPNSFGLTIEEILTAKDKELNRWCSLKKAIQHRPEHIEKYDVIAFEKKGRNVDLKKKYLPSLFTAEKTDNVQVEITNKRKKKNTLQDTETEETEALSKTEEEVASTQVKAATNKKRKKNNLQESKAEAAEALNRTEEDSESAQVKGATRKKRRKKNKVQPEETSTVKNNTEEAAPSVKEGKKSKLRQVGKSEAVSSKTRKRKRKLSDMQGADNTNAIELNKRQKKDKFSKKNKRKLKKIEPDIGLSDARLKAYGINPKKFKNKLKYGNK